MHGVAVVIKEKWCAAILAVFGWKDAGDSCDISDFVFAKDCDDLFFRPRMGVVVFRA